MSRYLAIDIDSAGLCVASGTVRPDGVAVERTLVWEDAGLPLTTASAAGLGERFRASLNAAQIAPAPVLVGVGRDRVILKELRFPPVPAVEEPNIVRFQTMKDLSEAAEEVVLDYVPAPPGGGEPRRATVYVLRKEQYQAVQAFATAAGLRLAGVTPRPFAVAAALRRAIASGAVPAPPRADDPIAVLHVGPHGGEFTVARGEQITFTRTIPASAASSPDMLTAEVKRNLAVYSGPNAQHPLAAVYVAEADTPGHAGRLKQALTVAVHGFDPLSDASTAVPADAAGRFAGAVGLLALRTTDLPINFASPRQPKPEANPNRRILVLTALACTLLLAGGAVLGFLQLSQANNRLASAMEQKKSSEEQLTQLDSDSKRMQAVDDWSKREVVWLDEMYDMFNRFQDINNARVSAFTGNAMPVDKAGKQIAQGRMEVKVNAGSASPVDSVLAALDKDNADKTKFYLDTKKMVNGLNSSSTAGALNMLFTIGTYVNHRQPSDFTRQAVLSAPPIPSRTTTTYASTPAATTTTTPASTATTTPAAKIDIKTPPGYKAPNFNDDWFK